MIRRDIITNLAPRLTGEEFLLFGQNLAVVGNIPTDGEIAFNRQDGVRVPLANIRKIRWPGGFKSVWLFHSQQLPGYAGANANLTLIAYDDGELQADVIDGLRSSTPLGVNRGDFSQLSYTPLAFLTDDGFASWVPDYGLNIGIDQQPALTPYARRVASVLMGFNASQNGFDRIRTAAAAAMAAFSTKGALLVSAAGDWSASHAPGAATQAVAGKPAPGAGLRYVVTSISATLSTGATALATPILLTLSDSSGTLWQKQVMLAASQTWEFNLSQLNIVCAANSAVNLTFQTPPGGAYVCAAMTGHTAQ